MPPRPARPVTPLAQAKAECKFSLARAKAADVRMAPTCDRFLADTLMKIDGAPVPAAVEMLRRTRIWADIVFDSATNWPLGSR